MEFIDKLIYVQLIIGRLGKKRPWAGGILILLIVLAVLSS